MTFCYRENRYGYILAECSVHEDFFKAYILPVVGEWYTLAGTGQMGGESLEWDADPDAEVDCLGRRRCTLVNTYLDDDVVRVWLQFGIRG